MELVTIDTHTPDGYVCEDCQHKYKSQYANVIACQSKQVNNFINWCKSQPWYENTTIVITGDHNSMSEKFLLILITIMFGHHTTALLIVQLLQNLIKPKIFNYWYVSYYFSSNGVKIDGNKLGLGVNLFSGEKTLIEQYGYRKINQEVKKKSRYYRHKLIGDDIKECEQKELSNEVIKIVH